MTEVPQILERSTSTMSVEEVSVIRDFAHVANAVYAEIPAAIEGLRESIPYTFPHEVTEELSGVLHDALTEAKWTLDEVDAFTARYELIDAVDGPTGFRAAVFRDVSSGDRGSAPHPRTRRCLGEVASVLRPRAAGQCGSFLPYGKSSATRKPVLRLCTDPVWGASWHRYERNLG